MIIQKKQFDAAIYARKSRATEKGESIENQINRCIAYCKTKERTYKIYKDNNFSGKNLDRPAFRELIHDAKGGVFKTLISYRLDRVTRSLNDFSTLSGEFSNMGIGTVFLKESFDTSTPMGRAMMNISAVFAQETIAKE
ncbi:MAG: recombinase family protein [Clostridiales bacterium]|nr:recombinase family protein [Clostridiales bacterium]